MTRRHRYWPVLVVVAAGVGVAGIHFAVERFTREQPNYTLIEDGIYLGGYVPEPPPGTRAVLNLCEAEDPYHAEVHAWEPIRDAEPAPSLDWLRRQVAFIEAQRAAGRVVFVHCQNGVSRSGMVLAAYLVARDGRSRDDAMAFLRSKRPGVRPNPAFVVLLLEWERALADRRG